MCCELTLSTPTYEYLLKVMTADLTQKYESSVLLNLVMCTLTISSAQLLVVLSGMLYFFAPCKFFFPPTLVTSCYHPFLRNVI